MLALAGRRTASGEICRHVPSHGRSSGAQLRSLFVSLDAARAAASHSRGRQESLHRRAARFSGRACTQRRPHAVNRDSTSRMHASRATRVHCAPRQDAHACARRRRAQSLQLLLCINGFAAELTAAQVAKLRADPNVISVARNEIRKLDTLTTPAFLGLERAQRRVGPGGRRATAPATDVIVGVIDTGIWPEHPSFAPRPPHSGPPPRLERHLPGGRAVSRHELQQQADRRALVQRGIRRRRCGPLDLFSYEFVSPRAAEGHGVHTAGTAVGNYRVNAEAQRREARLHQWHGACGAARSLQGVLGLCGRSGSGCATVDSVAAIDQAVADGVDVINFSIGGSLDELRRSHRVRILARGGCRRLRCHCRRQ